MVGLHFENELTVLSACNTGTGKLLEGEGVLSLAREFTLAGSKSTLTSFWSIDDCNTSKIMKGYYENLLAGLPKDQALRNAKLTFLENADKEASHPYYWAAFLQFGAVETLYDTGFHWNLYLLISIGLIALFFLLKKRFIK